MTSSTTVSAEKTRFKVKIAFFNVVYVFLLLVIKGYTAQNVEDIANKYEENGFIDTIYYEPITLNPILCRDTASSAVIEDMFCGLLATDKNGMVTKPSLAESWKIYEEVYLIPNSYRNLPNNKPSNAKNIVSYLKSAMQKNSKLPRQEQNQCLSNIRKIEIKNTEEISIEIDGYYTNLLTSRREHVRGNLTIMFPQRVKITLEQVDEFFQDSVSKLFGKDYFKDTDVSSFSKFEKVAENYRKNILNRYLKPYEENPVIVFRLRKGVKFHDGHEFDAYDVKFTYNSIVNPRNNSPMACNFDLIKEVEVIDKHTIRIVYSIPFSPALRAWSIGILPEHLLNDKALYSEALKRGADPSEFSISDSRFSKNPIGTGHYKFVKWIPGKAIILEKNRDYFEGIPSLENIVHLVLPNGETARTLYKAGTTDIYDIPYGEISSFRENEKQYVFSGLAYTTTYIGYNLQKRLFQDKVIRKALAMSINYNEIIRELNFGEAVRTTGLYPINSLYYNTDIKHIKYAPQMAKKILADKRWKDSNDDGIIDKDGKPFCFTIVTNNNVHRNKILQYCKKYWQAVGIHVTIKSVEWKEFLRLISSGSFDAVISGWSIGIEPDLYPIFHSSQIGLNLLNSCYYKNEEADRFMELIRKTYYQERKIKYAHRLQEIIYEDQPYTFLYVGKWHTALSKQLVIRNKDEKGNLSYSPIKQTGSGDISYDFMDWVKLSEGK